MCYRPNYWLCCDPRDSPVFAFQVLNLQADVTTILAFSVATGDWAQVLMYPQQALTPPSVSPAQEIWNTDNAWLTEAKPLWKNSLEVAWKEVPTEAPGFDSLATTEGCRSRRIHREQAEGEGGRVCGLAASNCTGKEELDYFSYKSWSEDQRASAITFQLKVSKKMPLKLYRLARCFIAVPDLMWKQALCLRKVWNHRIGVGAFG